MPRAKSKVTRVGSSPKKRKGNPTVEAKTNVAPKRKVGKGVCAFCQGTGKDRFGCLSHLSNCQACGGTGKTGVRGPTSICAFCRGTGVQPGTTDRLHCVVCGGKGEVPPVKSPGQCVACDGTGRQTFQTFRGTRYVRQYCLKCKGRGSLPAERASHCMKFEPTSVRGNLGRSSLNACVGDCANALPAGGRTDHGKS